VGGRKKDKSGRDVLPATPDKDGGEKLTRKQRAERAMLDWPPTAKDFRAWMDLRGLSSKDVAKALKLSDGRVVRFWTSKKNPRQIPYPSWYTLRHKFER
jgi:hypothetical protein